MKGSLRAAALVVAVAWVSIAHADKERARELYRAATHHYDFGEYQQALDGFKQAYEHYEDPAFLFNIAQCHRALGNKQEAVTFYRSYLRNTPAAANRDEVARIVGELQSKIDSESRAAPPASPPPPVAAVAMTAVPSPALTPAPPSSQRDKAPLYRRWWLWTSVAAVALAGATAGVLAATLPRSSSAPEFPAVRF